MRVLSSMEFLAAAGVKRDSYNASVSYKKAAFAFGAMYLPRGGSFLPLDAGAWLITDELTPAFGRKLAAGIVRERWTDCLRAISLAEHSASPEPVYLIVGEYGAPITDGPREFRARRQFVRTSAGRLSEFGELLNNMPYTDQFAARATLINITDVLARVRANAARIGLDLSEPFYPPVDDPEFDRQTRKLIAARKSATVEANIP